jgi:hypothetical protein
MYNVTDDTFLVDFFRWRPQLEPTIAQLVERRTVDGYFVPRTQRVVILRSLVRIRLVGVLSVAFYEGGFLFRLLILASNTISEDRRFLFLILSILMRKGRGNRRKMKGTELLY